MKNGQYAPPNIIGVFNNLEILPWRENVSKGSKCSITLHELLNLCAGNNHCQGEAE